MNLPIFSRKNSGLSKQDQEVFAEARELAALRLEQCVADMNISIPPMADSQPRHQPLKKLTSLF